MSSLACQTQALVGETVAELGQDGGGVGDFFQVNNSADSEKTPLPGGPLHARTECSQFDHKCYVIVTIIAHAEEVQTILEVEVISGIFFHWMDQKYEAAQTNHRRVRTTEFVEIIPGETRSFEIPYQIAMDANFPGEYAIAVRMLDPLEPDTKDPIATVYTKAFVGQSASGKMILLASQAEFDESYSAGFVDGHINNAYRIDLESIVHPKRGTLLVKMRAKDDIATPRLTITIDGGVYFRTPMLSEQPDKMVQTLTFGTDTLGQMFSGGSRVIITKFDLDVHSANGLYGIQTMREGGAEAGIERAPLGLELVQAIENRHDKWLVVTQDAGWHITTPTPTPTATPEPSPTFTPPAPPGVLPTQTPTIPFSAAAVQQVTEKEETPVAVVTATPMPPTRIPNGEVTVNSAETIVWNRSVTGFFGNLWRAYNVFVAGQFEMDYRHFKSEMKLHNPQLAGDLHVLQSGKTYLLPQLQPVLLTGND